MRKPTPACPLLASEWYSRWPLWRVVKLSSFLRTSQSPITSHFMLFSFSSSSSSCTCSSFSNVLTLYVAIFSRSTLVWWLFILNTFVYSRCVYHFWSALVMYGTHAICTYYKHIEKPLHFFTRNFYIKLPSLFHVKAFLVDFYRHIVASIGVSSTCDI